MVVWTEEVGMTVQEGEGEEGKGRVRTSGERGRKREREGGLKNDWW